MDPSGTLDPGSGWTIREDNVLIKHYINSNLNYEEIQRNLPTKKKRDCQDRWTYFLQQLGNKGAWTRHEDQILHVCQKEYGNRWKSIKNFLPGRSENAVKNRWNAILRKAAPSPPDKNTSRQDYNRLNSAEARRKMHAQQAQLRQLQTAGPAPNRSDMHLHLSPGAFGMHSDSPGPTADATWGNHSSMNSSFNFNFAGSPETPSKKGHASKSTGNTPSALKVDTSGSYPSGFYGAGSSRRGGKQLDESMSSMSREDMTELAEAFVAQEVEKFRKQHGETMSAEDQMLIRKAFVAGMQHDPPEKEMSASDLQWEFDQSGSIDAMISMDEDHGHFDGVVHGHAIFAQSAAKSPDGRLRFGLSMNSSIGGTRGHPGDLSIEGHSWGGPLHSDLLNTDNLDEMSMSLLNMSLEESQDVHSHAQASGFHS